MTRCCARGRRRSSGERGRGERLLLARAAAVTAAVAIAGCVPAPQAGGDDGGRIRHVMPWPAGSATDITMRGFLTHLEKRLDRRIFTENVAGGLSARGMLETRRAAADGATIGTMTYDILTIEFFDLVPVSWRDFDILGTVTEHPSALVVRADRWADLDAFRGDAAARRLKLGNVGNGGVFHQHAAGMQRELSTRFVHVPYTSSSAQLGALLGREVDAIVTGLPVVLPHVRHGTLRVLAVMSEQRHPLLPEAPTFLELGYHVWFSSFRMLVVPKSMPAATRTRLEAAVRDTWHDAEFQAWAQRTAIGAAWKDPAGSRAFIEQLSPRVMRILAEMDL